MCSWIEGLQTTLCGLSFVIIQWRQSDGYRPLFLLTRRSFSVASRATDLVAKVDLSRKIAIELATLNCSRLQSLILIFFRSPLMHGRFQLQAGSTPVHYP